MIASSELATGGRYCPMNLDTERGLSKFLGGTKDPHSRAATDTRVGLVLGGFATAFGTGRRFANRRSGCDSALIPMR